MKITVIILAINKMHVFSRPGVQRQKRIFFPSIKFYTLQYSLVDMMCFLNEKEVTSSGFLGHYFFLQLILFVYASHKLCVNLLINCYTSLAFSFVLIETSFPFIQS